MEILRYIVRRKKSSYEIIDLTACNNLSYTWEYVHRSIRWRHKKTDKMYIKLDNSDFTDHVLLEMLKYLTSLSKGFVIVAVDNFAPNATLLAQFADEIILAQPLLKGKAFSPHLFSYLKQKYDRYDIREIDNNLELSSLANSRNITQMEKSIFNVYTQPILIHGKDNEFTQDVKPMKIDENIAKMLQAKEQNSAKIPGRKIQVFQNYLRR